MTNLVKSNNKCGAKVGSITVFTREGAANAYRLFCELFNRRLDMASSVAQSAAALDMMNLGFTPVELERIEMETMGD